VDVVTCEDAGDLARRAAALFRDRLRERPALAMAVPAGRTPRGMYGVMQSLQPSSPVDFSRMRVFSVDELCPPAPPDGYFWRQVRAEFLAWAGVPAERCHPFAVDHPDLEAMCRDYERRIAEVGGLDLVMLGLGPNAHIASNEPPADFASRTRPVELLGATVRYILTDSVIQGAVCERAVTLGVATILEAREVVVLVSGAAKRPPLARLLAGPEGPDAPASVLRRHPRCTVIADRQAVEMAE
jgi:glucosamine-6-phosphate deaminase